MMLILSLLPCILFKIISTKHTVMYDKDSAGITAG
jgi:hypothetical protein